MTFPTPSSPAGLGSPLSSEQSTDRPQPQAGASPASRPILTSWSLGSRRS